MGIARGAYRLLLDEKKKGVLKGESILQLGRQCILFNQKDLLKYAKLHGVELEAADPVLSFEHTHRALGYIDDITLFKALGFKNVHSLDHSAYEGADLIWDLNREVPQEFWGKFDVIYDGGTSEHVFHFPQLLRNIHLMLKENGIIIHVSPSHNHVDHGFHMFSPQVFTEYYATNRFKILTSHIFEYSLDHRRPWYLYHYQPGLLDHYMGCFGKKLLAIHIVVQKMGESTVGLIPQQGCYVASWNQGSSAAPPLPQKKTHPVRRLAARFFYRFAKKRKLRPFAKY